MTKQTRTRIPEGTVRVNNVVTGKNHVMVPVELLNDLAETVAAHAKREYFDPRQQHKLDAEMETVLKARELIMQAEVSE